MKPEVREYLKKVKENFIDVLKDDPQAFSFYERDEYEKGLSEKEKKLLSSVNELVREGVALSTKLTTEVEAVQKGMRLVRSTDYTWMRGEVEKLQDEHEKSRYKDNREKNRDKILSLEIVDQLPLRVRGLLDIAELIVGYDKTLSFVRNIEEKVIQEFPELQEQNAAMLHMTQIIERANREQMAAGKKIEEQNRKIKAQEEVIEALKTQVKTLQKELSKTSPTAAVLEKKTQKEIKPKRKQS